MITSANLDIVGQVVKFHLLDTLYLKVKERLANCILNSVFE